MKIFDKFLKRSCNCQNAENTKEKKEISVKKDGVMNVKILGSGCKNCLTLTENVKSALNDMKIEANIEKVTDFKEISSYGILSTPGLVIDEKIVSYGKVLKSEDVKKIIEKL